jgi:hypothetical protein
VSPRTKANPAADQSPRGDPPAKGRSSGTSKKGKLTRSFSESSKVGRRVKKGDKEGTVEIDEEQKKKCVVM